MRMDISVHGFQIGKKCPQIGKYFLRFLCFLAHDPYLSRQATDVMPLDARLPLLS